MKLRSYGVCPYRIRNGSIQIMLIRPKGHVEYGFIKGKLDENETPMSCAVREAYEETGIVIDKNLLEDLFYQRNNRKDVGVYLVDECNIDFSNIKLSKREVGEYRWFYLTEYIEINKNQKEILLSIKNKFWKKRIPLFQNLTKN